MPANALCPNCNVEVAQLRSLRGNQGQLVWECRCPKCGRGGYHEPTKERRCPRCAHAWQEKVPFQFDLAEATQQAGAGGD